MRKSSFHKIQIFVLVVKDRRTETFTLGIFLPFFWQVYLFRYIRVDRNMLVETGGFGANPNSS